MSWHGIGLSSGSWIPLVRSKTAPSELAILAPALAWTGTAGSGFASAPTDPTRTLAKPALRLITPPNQHFTSELLVGVIAMADDGGSLFDNLGMAGVEFLYEGNTVTVDAPRWQAVDTPRGTRLYFGWWVRLQKEIGRIGKAQLYIRGTANDPSFQQRVIGPYLFSPQDVGHDLELEINPDLPVITGQRYQAFGPAIAYAGDQSAQNPRFTVTKAGKYDWGSVSANLFAHWDISGRYTLEASVPGVSIGRNAYTTDAETVLTSHSAFWRFKGPNVTFDARYGATLKTNVLFPKGGGGHHWADGCNITSTSPLGKRELIRGGQLPVGGLTNNVWYTEAEVTKVNQPVVDASLIRGTNVADVQSDIASNGLCIVNSTFQQSDQIDLNGNRSAFTMVYDGPESVATASRSGGNYSSGGGGLWTVVIGATTYTFDHANSTEAYYNDMPPGGYRGVSGLGGYWTTDVVDWLNTLPGVTATLTPQFVAQDRAAAALSVRGIAGQGFGTGAQSATYNTPRNFKTTPLEIVWHVDAHGDFYQHTRDNLENVIVAFNRAWELEVQLIYLAPPALLPELGGVSNERDIFFVGNQLAQIKIATVSQDPINGFSQFTRRCDYSHVVISHNSMPNQGFVIDSRPNQSVFLNNVVFANNAMRSIGYREGPLSNVVIENNHTHAANPSIPGGIFNISSGNQDSLYADFANGDFTPTGLLKAEGFVPRLPLDLNRTAFASPASPGAMSVPADVLRLFAPSFTASEITGDAADGKVLTATYNVIGSAPIAVTFQWQRNGVNIAGQTAQTVTLNGAAMGLVNTDTISCEITATNSVGAVVAEGTISFGSSFIDALVASSATVAVYDWTNTASMTAGDGGAVLQGAGDTIAIVPNAKAPGTRNLAQATVPAQPVYNNGAVFDGADDFMAAAFTANTGPANATLVYVVKTTDNDFMLGGTNNTSFFAGGATSGSGAAPHSGTGMTGTTYFANGAAVTPVTRGGLNAAWAKGTPVIARLAGTNFKNASISDIRNRWGNSGFNFNGRCMLVAILNGGDADYANALAAAEQEAARVITALGL